MNDWGEWVAYYTNTYGNMTYDQTVNNMYIIYRYFTEQGWTVNAIAAMIGNMYVESSGLNPAQFEGSYPVGTENGGYGLVQWTPRTKFSDWAGSGWMSNYDLQLKRISYELANGLQWMNVGFGSFYDFSRSSAEIDYLTEAFVRSYERPLDWTASISQRTMWAAIAYNLLTGEIPPYTKKKTKLLLLFRAAQNGNIKNLKHWGGD